MRKDFSPEERLLRLIRSKASRQAPSSASVPAPAPAAAPMPAATPKEKIRVVRLENLNLALVILLIGLLIYAAPFFLKRPKDPTWNLEERVKTQAKETEARSEEPERPTFDYPLGQAPLRNIFSPLVKEDLHPQAQVEEGPKLEEVKDKLSLLGVIGGESPQAIIEDKRTQKTYFLNKGSTFDDIEVGNILENKVILIYKGKEFELVL